MFAIEIIIKGRLEMIDGFRVYRGRRGVKVAEEVAHNLLDFGLGGREAEGRAREGHGDLLGEGTTQLCIGR